MPQKITKNQIAAQEAWITPTFTNSWGNYGNGFSTAAYMKDSMGFVHIRGMIAFGTVGATIMTLPAGYRPAGTSYFAVTSNTNPGIISIANTGVMKADGGGNGYISLEGITFKAEA